MPRSFIDTNIAVYAVDIQDPIKRSVAKRLITDLLNQGQAVVSSQVLVEFASTALGKLHLPAIGVCEQVRLLAANHVVPIAEDLVCDAVNARDAYQLSFWDACIIVAAERAGCGVLYTEDLNHGQQYGSVRAVNPFAPEAPAAEQSRAGPPVADG